MFSKKELNIAHKEIEKKLHVKLQKLRQYSLGTVYFQVLCSEIKSLADDLLWVSLKFKGDDEKNEE